jgi:hypothetical protein
MQRFGFHSEPQFQVCEMFSVGFTKKHFSLPVLGNVLRVVSYQIWPEPLQGSNDWPQTLRCDVLVSIHVYDDEDPITSYGIGGLVTVLCEGTVPAWLFVASFSWFILPFASLSLQALDLFGEGAQCPL